MPRIGMGMPIAAPTGRAPALSIVDNGVFEQIVSGEITPEFTTTRTNLTIYSQDVSQNTWTKSNVAVDGTAVEAPNNTTTAQAITGSANTSSRKTSQTTALTAGLTYTYSAYVKAVAFSHVRLSINDGTVEHTQDFNITNASNGSAGAASNVLRSEIEKLDNNWFRVMLTIQCQNSNSDATYGVLSMAANNTPNVQVAVGGTVLMHVWGQQFEQDIQANAYIATSNTTKTAATALVDVNSVWDFDGTDLVVEADPSDEGFWEAPDNIVLNGDYEELGSEVIVNGSFTGVANNTDVTTLTNWNTYNSPTSRNVVDNKLVVVATGGNQGAYYTPGALTGLHKLSVDVSGDVGAGAIYISDPATVISTSVGTVEHYFVGTGSSGTGIFFRAGSNSAGTTSYTNISVKKVDPNDRWSLGTGWSIEDGKLKGDGTNTDFQSAQQNNVTTVGDTYEVTVTVEAVSGAIELKGAGVYTRIDTLGVGTHTFTFVADATYIRFLAHASATITLDNFTVTEYAIQPQDV